MYKVKVLDPRLGICQMMERTGKKVMVIDQNIGNDGRAEESIIIKRGNRFVGLRKVSSYNLQARTFTAAARFAVQRYAYDYNDGESFGTISTSAGNVDPAIEDQTHILAANRPASPDDSYETLTRLVLQFDTTGGAFEDKSIIQAYVKFGVCNKSNNTGLLATETKLSMVKINGNLSLDYTDYDKFTNERLANDIPYANIVSGNALWFQLSPTQRYYVNRNGLTNIGITFSADVAKPTKLSSWTDTDFLKFGFGYAATNPIQLIVYTPY